MKRLAVETSTHSCSVALQVGDDILQRQQIEERAHTRLLLPMVDSLLEEAGLKLQQLDDLVLGAGPGSFTGVRLAASCIQGLALGCELPIVRVSSLAALAHSISFIQSEQALFCALDARMGELYCAQFLQVAPGESQRVSEDELLAVKDIVLSKKFKWLGVGTGFSVQPEQLQAANPTLTLPASIAYPTAEGALRAAKNLRATETWIGNNQASPNYIRNQVVKK